MQVIDFRVEVLKKYHCGAYKGKIACGDPGGNRTPNTRLRTAVFYPLNYRAIALL